MAIPRPGYKVATKSCKIGCWPGLVYVLGHPNIRSSGNVYVPSHAVKIWDSGHVYMPGHPRIWVSGNFYMHGTLLLPKLLWQLKKMPLGAPLDIKCSTLFHFL